MTTGTDAPIGVQRNSRGMEKLMFSTRPSISSGGAAPMAASRSITARTSTSGAEAPAVIPMRRLPSNHSARISSGPSIS